MAMNKCICCGASIPEGHHACPHCLVHVTQPANEKRLTEKDKIAYYAIEKFIKENGYPPTVRELCRILGKVSTATVHYRLKSLKQKGYITATDGGNRTIRLMKEVENAPAV
jgi:repressor LexA